MDNLGRIRREVGPITPELSDALADHMNVRRGEVHEVVSFYSFLEVPVDAVRVCIGPVCDCFGAKDLLAREQEKANGVPVLGVECLGHCDIAPVLTRGDVVEPEVTRRTNTGSSLGLEQADQTLADYEARGGLSVLRNLPPREKIVEELKASGLSGYGGAGFPTGLKWEAVAKEPAPRYVVVNADEGEPGTIKDRYVMELRPHLMLEGTLIAMDFAEATEGFIYLREEYATARDRLEQALDEFRAAGLLDGRSLELVIGAGAYICGEETAMLESMEGRRGMPRLKPPFPSQVGYLGRPTLINNVETLAHIPAILTGGGEAWPRGPPLVGDRRRAGARLLRGAARRHAEAADRRLRGRSHRGDRCDRPRRRGERDPSAGRARRAAHPREPARVERRPGLRRRAGLPGELFAPAAPRRDHALLRRGVVPEVHALPDRQPRHAPPRRGARERRGGDDARAGRGVARRDGRDLDLRSRPGCAVPDAERVQALARSLRAARGARNKMSSMVRFTLDGREASAPEGELLVHAAARHGVFIPTLCHDDKLDPYGGCRMCVVGVEGSPRPLPACATRVTEGMAVSTNSSVPAYRKTLTEMLLAEHLDPNPGGRPNELTDLANELDAEAPFVLPDAKREDYEDRNRLMGYTPDACILCNRCVRYTQEVMQCSALSLEGRGPHARIVPTWERSWLDTECELCGGCLSVCPTGAIFEKFLEGTEQPRARAREDEDDLHLLRRRLPDRPERRPARRTGS